MSEKENGRNVIKRQEKKVDNTRGTSRLRRKGDNTRRLENHEIYVNTKQGKNYH